MANRRAEMRKIRETLHPTRCSQLPSVLAPDNFPQPNYVVNV